MLRLYDYPDSGNGYKVRLLLRHLDIPFELIEKDIIAGETRTPEYLAMNPNGRIPLLETEDGAFLPESNAILCYLAEGTPWLPDDRLEKAQALQWMFFEQYNHEPNIATSRFILRHTGEDDPRRALLDARREAGYAALGVMESHLQDRDWFAGNRMTIADIALYAYTHVAHEGGFDLENYAAVRAWLDRIAARPGHVTMLAA